MNVTQETLGEPKTEQLFSRLPQLKEKMTLAEILSVWDAMDSGKIELTLDEMKEIGAKAAVKVDGYKQFLDRAKLQVEYLQNKAKEFTDAAGVVKNTIKNVQDLMMFHLKNHIEPDANGKRRLPGVDFQVLLVEKKTQSLTLQPGAGVPNSGHFLRMKGFVKRSYSWDNAEIKKNLQSEAPDPNLAELFKIEDKDSSYLKFSVRKGVEK